MKTPILETERLLLRPLTTNDAESAFSNWTSDPDIAKFMRWELHSNISETFEWLVSEETLIESDNVYTAAEAEEKMEKLASSDKPYLLVCHVDPMEATLS